MKRLASRLTWWHTLPHKSTSRSTPQRGRGQPWTILASTCTSGKARSTSSPRAARSSSGASGPSRSALTPCWEPGPAPGLCSRSSTDSEWVARCLRRSATRSSSPTRTSRPMCAIRTRKVKTDRRDARALAEACLLGAYRPAHRLSDPQRQVRGRLVTGALDYQSAANCEIWARRIGLRTQRASPTPRSPWGFGAVPERPREAGIVCGKNEPRDRDPAQEAAACTHATA